MAPHQLVPLNYLNRFPSDILIHVFTQLGVACHELPLHLYGFPSVRLVCKYICGVVTPLVFRRMDLASARLCFKLRSTPDELSGIFEGIGQHVRVVTIRPSDPSSRTEIDEALATALKEMPKLHTITIIYDPLDTRQHSPLLGALRQLRNLENITLAEPPCFDWPYGWPVRLGLQEPSTQQEEVGTVEETSESGSERAPDTDTDDTDTNIDIDTMAQGEVEVEVGTVSHIGVTKNLHSFRKLCLATLLKHHAPRLVSVRLLGSIPLDVRNYRRLRDKTPNLHVLQLVGAFDDSETPSCKREQGLMAAFAEDTRWACSGGLRHLSILGPGGSLGAVLEARVMRQVRLGVFGEGLDEPPSVSAGKN